MDNVKYAMTFEEFVSARDITFNNQDDFNDDKYAPKEPTDIDKPSHNYKLNLRNNAHMNMLRDNANLGQWKIRVTNKYSGQSLDINGQDMFDDLVVENGEFRGIPAIDKDEILGFLDSEDVKIGAGIDTETFIVKVIGHSDEWKGLAERKLPVMMFEEYTITNNKDFVPSASFTKERLHDIAKVRLVGELLTVCSKLDSTKNEEDKYALQEILGTDVFWKKPDGRWYSSTKMMFDMTVAELQEKIDKINATEPVGQTHE
jgi:hypothetical protein